ncbi:hypothetical protein LA5094_04887 [Roseibium album]|nr:hypothetical protein LA5094_04887 [Roseibium album]
MKKRTIIRRLNIMLKLFMRRQARATSPSWYDRTDPLSHPAIQRMSPRELADLPLTRR